MSIERQSRRVSMFPPLGVGGLAGLSATLTDNDHSNRSNGPFYRRKTQTANWHDYSYI